MVVFSAKFNRKRAIVAVVVLAVVLILIVLLAGLRDNNGNAQATMGAIVKDNGERVKFLEDLGWKVEEEPIEEQEVLIPKEFSEVYKRYNEIQLAQGYDLTKYGGIEAKRFTYRILNYPGEEIAAVADIIVYRNEIIAGDVQSNKLNGFMDGLAYPK